MSRNRKIKMSLSIDCSGFSREDEEELPEGWDDMSKIDQTRYLNDVADEFGGTYIDLNAWVE